MNSFCRSLLTIALCTCCVHNLSGGVDALKRAKLNRLTDEQRALSKARARVQSQAVAMEIVSEVRDASGEKILQTASKTSRTKNETPEQLLWRVISQLANQGALEEVAE